MQEQYRVHTIFIGGGTPTCLPARCLIKIGTAIRESFDCTALTEFSTEANPGTVTTEHIKAWQQMGINRVSLGLQSAQNRELKMLGRIHSYEDFLQTYERIRQSGISNINIDVMAAIPEQTVESYRDTLEKVAALKPEHISSYSLIVEPGTLFGNWEENGTLKRVDEDTDRRMYEWTGKYLQQMGYHRYEISNYCQSGMECKHNCVYWTGGEYLGLGVNASSYLKGYRFRVPLSAKEYRLYVDRISGLSRKMDGVCADQIKGVSEKADSVCANQIGGVSKKADSVCANQIGGVSEKVDSACADQSDRLSSKDPDKPALDSAIQEMDELECVDRKAQMEEFMFLGLRMMEGVSEQEFYQRFGTPIMEVYGDVIMKYQRLGLICRKSTGRVALTEKGIDVSNSILSDFLLS